MSDPNNEPSKRPSEGWGTNTTKLSTSLAGHSEYQGDIFRAAQVIVTKQVLGRYGFQPVTWSEGSQRGHVVC